MNSIQDILNHSFDQYAKRHQLLSHFRRAAYQMMTCRTAKLGGHKQVCPNGHIERCWYNSCKHRSCPQCNAIQIERWLEFQKARMLDCSHYHIVFTIPHELNPLWQVNSGNVMNILFQSAKETLFDFLKDPKYLGAMPGVMMTFHSWGRDLRVHPHIHALVTDGGLTQDGEWRDLKKGCFLPARAVMAMFRGKFVDLIHKALSKDKLDLPVRYSRHQLINTLNKVRFTKKWNVNIQERYAHGTGVVTYFGLYVRGGPLKNSQLINMSEDKVSFQYYSHRDNPNGKKKHASILTLKHEEFFKRFLIHVLEKGRQVVRSYGMYAHTKTEALNKAREIKGQASVKSVSYLAWQTYYESKHKTRDDITLCPICRATIIIGGEIRPKQGGP